jgi:hypothetical protein
MTTSPLVLAFNSAGNVVEATLMSVRLRWPQTASLKRSTRSDTGHRDKPDVSGPAGPIRASSSRSLLPDSGG